MLNWFHRKLASGIRGPDYTGGRFAKYAAPDNLGKLFYGTERLEKEIYLLVGCTLVKVKLEALKREGFSEYAGFRCNILEIDGVPVSLKDREDSAESFGSRDHAPDAKEQQDVLGRALENLGICGKIAQVTESYVLGHLKVLKLRQRVGERS